MFYSKLIRNMNAQLKEIAYFRMDWDDSSQSNYVGYTFYKNPKIIIEVSRSTTSIPGIYDISIIDKNTHVVIEHGTNINLDDISLFISLNSL